MSVASARPVSPPGPARHSLSRLLIGSSSSGPSGCPAPARGNAHQDRPLRALLPPTPCGVLRECFLREAGADKSALREGGKRGLRREKGETPASQVGGSLNPAPVGRAERSCPGTSSSAVTCNVCELVQNSGDRFPLRQGVQGSEMPLFPGLGAGHSRHQLWAQFAALGSSWELSKEARFPAPSAEAGKWVCGLHPGKGGEGRKKKWRKIKDRPRWKLTNGAIRSR